MSRVIYRVLGDVGRSFMLPFPADDLTPENLMQINALIEALLGRPRPVERKDLAGLGASDSRTYVVLACTVDESGRRKIVGMGSLVMSEQIVGDKGHIEDVVVSRDCRGMGLGRELMVALIKLARHLAADQLKLTSAPERIEANKLYASLGFELHYNCYRMKL